ncbi:cobalt-precorrin 5A hydrolase [Anaerolentibacter hominis]|uniref:cobalt-precorrin 5A hydrolase n=1 Tax=Anaerolentibacter hominis TaxID=3079009 RepID=UPI0031B899D1
MKISILSFTTQGGVLNKKLCDALSGMGHQTEGFAYESSDLAGLTPFSDLGVLTCRLFSTQDALIFLSACGIAVRAVAPCIQNKWEDPAVLVMDDAGLHVISLLSGHTGGANKLARLVGRLCGAVPVITTATDVNYKFAVDVWAAEHGLAVTDSALAKAVSAAVLKEKPVGFSCGYPCEGCMPEGFCTGKAELGICVGEQTVQTEFDRTLYLPPKNLTLGMGCRKGTDRSALETFVREIYRQYGLTIERTVFLVSIEDKKEEPGLVSLAESLGVPFMTYAANDLNLLDDKPGHPVFAASEFVRQTVGADNVCERSAWLGSGFGVCLIPKQKKEGMTLSVYESAYTLNLKEEG